MVGAILNNRVQEVAIFIVRVGGIRVEISINNMISEMVNVLASLLKSLAADQPIQV